MNIILHFFTKKNHENVDFAKKYNNRIYCKRKSESIMASDRKCRGLCPICRQARYLLPFFAFLS